MSQDPFKQKTGFWDFFDALDFVEAAFFVLLGTALFLGFNYAIARAVWVSGSPLLIAAYAALVIGTLMQCGVDLYKRRFSPTSYALAATWGLCVCAVVLQFAAV